LVKVKKLIPVGLGEGFSLKIGTWLGGQFKGREGLFPKERPFGRL